MNTSGAFRIRRISEWLGSSANEDILRTGGLAEGRGRLLNIDEYVVFYLSSIANSQVLARGRTLQDLRMVLFSELPETNTLLQSRSRVVTSSYVQNSTFCVSP
jgi:hypothetical protein